MKRTPLKRGKPMARGSKRLARAKSLPKHRTPERKAKEFARCYLSTAYVKFCQRQPCAACGRGPCDAAHGRTDGMGRKAGWETLLPLCSGLSGCHARQHRSGWASIAMTEESRRRASANLRLAWADHLHEPEDA